VTTKLFSLDSTLLSSIFAQTEKILVILQCLLRQFFARICLAFTEFARFFSVKRQTSFFTLLLHGYAQTCSFPSFNVQHEVTLLFSAVFPLIILQVL